MTATRPRPSEIFRKRSPERMNEVRPRPYVDGHNDAQVLRGIAAVLDSGMFNRVLIDMAGDLLDVANRIEQSNVSGGQSQ